MNILRGLRLPAILLAVLTAVSLAYAQATPVDQAAPDVSITLTADKLDGLTVGDPVTLHLSVTHTAEVRVLPEQLPQVWGDFEVRSQSLAVVNTNADGTVTTSQDIGVALYTPGDFTTPPFTVTVITPDGKSADQTAPPVTLTVASVLTQDDTALRDIRPQADLQPPSPLPEILAGFAGAAVLLAVLALIYRRFFRRRHVQTVGVSVDLRTPYERARDALDELELQNLVGQGMYKAYYSHLSEVLRTYIDDVYDVNAPDMTTFEIRRRLKEVRELDSALAQRALRVLSECDLVKFAKSEPDHDAARVLLEEVRVWLDLTHPAPLPDAVESVAEGAA